MTKIEELENKLICEGIKKDDLNTYETLLKRSGSDYNRLQHCYITAWKFPQERYEQGIRLIEWGIERYQSDWYSVYTAYNYIGHMWEINGRYREAYEAYLKSWDAIKDNEENTYKQLLSGDLMWMRIHIDKFKYSETLEEYYRMFKKISGVERDFIKNEYRLAVTEIVIFKKYNMKEEARRAYNDAVRISKPDYVSHAQAMLSSHGVVDELRTTPECIRFLKHVRI